MYYAYIWNCQRTNYKILSTVWRSKNCKSLSFTRKLQLQKDDVKLKTAVNKITDVNNSINTLMDFVKSKMLRAENWLPGNLITRAEWQN